MDSVNNSSSYIKSVPVPFQKVTFSFLSKALAAFILEINFGNYNICINNKCSSKECPVQWFLIKSEEKQLSPSV